MSPTIPNKTKIATQADSVQTPIHIAQLIINHFNPKGLILEPCKGDGNIYNLLPEPKLWCEIKENKDFFDFNQQVDWIFTNPPYSIFDKFMEHAFKLASEVVVLVPLQKAFKSMSYINLVNDYGGLKEILIIGSGSKAGFKMGFPVGCLYYQKNYKDNKTKITTLKA